MAGERSLTGCTVAVGREDPGVLATLLADRGAAMLHIPLIATVDPVDGGVQLRAELERLDRYDWLVVSSVHGADRVGAAAAGSPHVGLAAVGRSTAERLAALAGREVDVVPASQTARALGEELAPLLDPSRSVLVAVADRSEGHLEAALEGSGAAVTSVIAYRTVLRRPDEVSVRRIVEEADALLLTSGSSALSWADAPGTEDFHGAILAIGPSTAAAARRTGVPITAVAAEHSLVGLVDALVAWALRR